MKKTRGRENRRSKRIEIPKGLWVAWRTDGSSSGSRVRDLSIGGIFISTETPLSNGSRIQLLFSLPEGEVRVEGVVRYATAGKGMGVEFTHMQTADHARLREMIRRLNT